MALYKKIINKLINNNITISVAESCTGGMISSKLTSEAGISKVFSMGLITYSNIAKSNLLNISPYYINKYGAVSKQTCLSMAKNLNKIAKTDISVSITGIAGPGGGTVLKPVGLTYVGIKFRKKIMYKKFLIQNKNRNYIQRKIVKKSLKMIYDLI